ncbi:MAG: OmpA family protein [Salibacteraceae bacterium]
MGTKLLKEGAKLLQEADVSNIVSSLSIGIAEAQAAMDQNSIKQTQLLAADTSVGDGSKSLLEMGFSAAFYHFQYADVSASISLKMKQKNEIEVDAGIEAEYIKKTGVETYKKDYLKESKDASYHKGFKSSREFLMQADESKSLKVSSSSVKMDQSQGSMTKVAKFEEKLRQSAEVSRVFTDVRSQDLAVVNQTNTSAGVVVHNSGGYITITLPPAINNDYGLLKVEAYPATAEEVDLDGPSGSTATAKFDIFTDFETTYNAAKVAVGTGGIAIGFSKDEIRDGSTVIDMPLEVNFEWDRAVMKDNYHDNAVVLPYLEKLVYILKQNPSAELDLVGYTDGSGANSYNLPLSEKRVIHIKEWFEGKGVPSGQLSTEFKGEVLAGGSSNKDVELRKVTIALKSDDDFIYFEGGYFDHTATPATATASGNVFLDTVDTSSPVTNYNIEFTLGSHGTFTFANMANLAAIVAHVSQTQTLSDAFSAEVVSNTAYLLHNETMLKFSLLSASSEDIEVSSSSSNSTSNQQSADSFVIAKSQNSKSRVAEQSEKIKDPSSFAVGGSVDFRTARQFDINVEGNASVSVRLVSLPAPSEFLEELNKS